MYWLIELTVEGDEGKFGWDRHLTFPAAAALGNNATPQNVQDHSGSSAHAGQSKLRTRLIHGFEWKQHQRWNRVNIGL